MQILAWPAPSPTEPNPYISLIYDEFEKCGAKIETFSPWRLTFATSDVFHIHWPEAILWGRLARLSSKISQLVGYNVLCTMDLIRKNGGSVVWTAHNLVPHSTPSRPHQRTWDDFFLKFRGRVDHIIGLTESSMELLRNRYPDIRNVPFSVVPHPHYRTAYPKPPSKAVAREALKLPTDKFIVGIIGEIRCSKNIPHAIRAFHGARKNDEFLFVSGFCSDSQLAAEIVVSTDDYVRFDDDTLSRSALVQCIAAADVILMAQPTTLNSATVLLGLSFDRPVIAPHIGSITELKGVTGSNWLSTFAGELTAEALRVCIDEIRWTKRAPRSPIDQFDPKKISVQTFNVLRNARRQAR